MNSKRADQKYFMNSDFVKDRLYTKNMIYLKEEDFKRDSVHIKRNSKN